MKTDFVRQEDEEAKENEPRYRDEKKQEEEFGRGRQDATMRDGRLLQRRAEHSGLARCDAVHTTFRDVTLSTRRFELSRRLRPTEYTNFISISFTFQVITAPTTNPLGSVIEFGSVSTPFCA